VTLEHLRAQGALGDLYITGCCWGGRIAYLLAARHPEVKLLVPFYEHLTAWSGPEGNKPYSPLEEASKITARVVGSYGGGDDSIPLTDVSQMEEQLRAAGRTAELKVYDGAPHCFFRTPRVGDSLQRRLAMSALKDVSA
jgi:carboxymethylenebutenolidase